MASPKETIMLLKVDLDCPRCYKKVKKLLCSFPQIKDQVYNEKQGTVMIKVVCCDPERIRDKLCCKGAKSIISIEILEPPKPKPEPPKSDPPKPATPPKAEPPKPAPVPMPEPIHCRPVCCSDCYEGRNTGPCYNGGYGYVYRYGYGYGCPPPPKQAPVPMPEPVHSRPTCCSDCYEGRSTGPCNTGYGYGCPPPPPPPGNGWWYYDGCPPGVYSRVTL